MNPLAEIFGYPPDNTSSTAKRYRENRLCPFNNKVPSCTKDKAKDPLGVCSVATRDGPVITCPIRFREDWMIVDDAANFFFGPDANWTSLAEVRLRDYYGKSAGNIDLVLVAYDDSGKVYDFGALEVQAVYISGNVREPFNRYISNMNKKQPLEWNDCYFSVRPDFLSSSRKRLAPQLLFKGGILNEWDKNIAVAIDSQFFNTLPPLKRVKKSKSDLAWLIYDLAEIDSDKYRLNKQDIIYTRFNEALNSITRPKAGELDKFVQVLQSKVDKILENAPVNQLIKNPFER